jgi:integrase/recombinase XerC
MEIPCSFGVQKLTTEYLKINKTDRIQCSEKRMKSSLARIKLISKIDTINEETLVELDKILSNIFTNKQNNEHYNFDRDASSISRHVLGDLFSFSFPITSGLFRCQNDIPPNLLIYCNEDRGVNKFVINYLNYAKKNIKSMKTIKGYIGYFVHTFIPLKDKFINNNVTREDIISIIQNIEHKSKDDVKTKDLTFNVDTLSNSATKALNTFNSIINSKLVDCLKNAMIIKPKDINIKNKNVERIEKDYFTDEELDKLVTVYENDQECLIISILLSTGVRLGGLLNLKIRNVYDSNLNVLSEGSTLEKGNKTRRFPIFPALKQALERYRDNETYKDLLKDLDYYLIPKVIKKRSKFIGNKQKCGETTIRRIIKNICDRAGVYGDHTHPHAFRKTVVIKLMNEGNTLDSVAKFIGHSSSQITATHYWTPTQNDLIKNMNMAWLLGQKGESSVNSTHNTLQMKQITQLIMEGMIAKERLEHALSIMTHKQVLQMEEKWTTNSDDNVAQNTRNAIASILDMSSTISEIVSNYNNDNESINSE